MKRTVALCRVGSKKIRKILWKHRKTVIELLLLAIRVVLKFLAD